MFLRPLDVRFLAALVSSAKQNHNRLAVPSAVDAIAWAYMDSKLDDAFANGFDVAQIPGLHLSRKLSNHSIKGSEPSFR